MAILELQEPVVGGRTPDFGSTTSITNGFRSPEVGFGAQGGTHMGRRPRPRHYVPWPLATILGATLFRYSDRRRAYVLRVVGKRWGPVLREY